MIIDWYPGHMKKARAQILEVLPTIDLVIEVLDARLPASSASAPRTIDLPAPVSPVRRVRPGPNSPSSSEISAMLLIRNNLSMQLVQ